MNSIYQKNCQSDTLNQCTNKMALDKFEQLAKYPCFRLCSLKNWNELLFGYGLQYGEIYKTQSVDFLECDRIIHEPQEDQFENVKNDPLMIETSGGDVDCPDQELAMRKMGELFWHFLKGQDPLAVLIRNLMKEEEKIPDEVPHRTPLADWIDGSDVMQALHISQRTLQTLRSNGTLPYSQIGGKIYYKKKVLEDLLERNYGINQSGKEGTYGK